MYARRLMSGSTSESCSLFSGVRGIPESHTKIIQLTVRPCLLLARDFLKEESPWALEDEIPNERCYAFILRI